MPDDETKQLLMARVERVKGDLDAWASKVPEFDFNPAGTPLFSMIELAYSFARRASDFGRAILSLQKRNQLIPAAVVARALIETAAMGCLFVHDMHRLIASGDRERLDARLTKFYAGVRDTDFTPVHVLDAIRHLDKIDKSYFRELFARHAELVDKLRKRLPESPSELLEPDVESNYAFLSEVTHPNGTGTQLIYGEDGAEDARAMVAERVAFLSSAAIWQCHHLVRSLEDTRTLPDAFRRRFPKTDS